MDYRTNYYISGKRCGACQELKGRVCLMTIMVDDGESCWEDKTIHHFDDVLHMTKDYLLEESQRYDVSLSLIIQYRFVRSEAIISFSSPKKDLDDIVKSIWHQSIDEVQAKLKKDGSYDEVALLFILNKRGRSSAVMSHSQKNNDGEFARLFFSNWASDIQKSRAIAHETLHLFGACDFYIIDSVKELTRKHLGKSIMNEAFNVDDLLVDSLTAYAIGWSDDLDINAARFLDATQSITKDYYRQAVKKNTYTGTTLKKYSNGDLYYGELKDGLKSGQGTMKYRRGGYYEGQWLNNNYHGLGLYFYPNGDVYKGYWKNHHRCGQGVYYFASGDVYIGYWNNMREGQGLYLYASGSYFYGQWSNGKINGTGIMVGHDHSLYYGHWQDSKRQGLGIYLSSDGSIYDGSWANNEKEGAGIAIDKEGTRDYGYYEKGQKVKQLSSIDSDNKLKIYESGTIGYGQYKNGLLEGQALILFSNGSIYCGQWLHNEFNGMGISIDKEGNVFDGLFKDHHRLKGKEFRKDGQINEM